MEQTKADSQPTVQMTSETHGKQRPSLIEFLTGGELGRHGSKIISDHHQGHLSHTKGCVNFFLS